MVAQTTETVVKVVKKDPRLDIEFKADQFADGVHGVMREREEAKMVPGFWPKKVEERSCHLLR